MGWWLVALLVVALYWVLPEILLHYLHFAVVAAPRTVMDYVCLTFDDGPGAATEEVLRQLGAHGARATFFLVGTEAAAREELVRRIAAEGHEVASHGGVHRSAWLLGPVGTWLQILRGRERIAAIAGRTPQFFRPPWGQFNLLVLPFARALGQRVALWSYDPGDWRPAQDPQALAARILKALSPGQIYLLHDAGGDGRVHTARALEIALPEIAARGYRVVPLTELLDHHERQPLPRRVLQAVWGIVEALFEKTHGVERIGDARSTLRIGRVTYRGLPARLQDGRTVMPGDVVGELHFRNPQLAALGAVRALPVMQRTMRDLAQLIQTEPKYRDLDVFFGISVAFRGAKRFGFEVTDLGFSRWRRFTAGTYLRWVMSVYHPQGLERLSHRREMLEPKGVFITRETLLRRYGDTAPAEQSRPKEG